MSQDDKAGLILSDIVAASLTEGGEGYSQAFVEMPIVFSSDKIEQLNTTSYLTWLKSLRLKGAVSYTYSGIPLLINTIEVDPGSSEILSGKVGTNIQVRILGKRAELSESSLVTFYSKGGIKNVSIKHFEYYTNEATLDLGGEFEISPTGHILSATLNKKSTVQINRCLVNIPSGSPITFSKNTFRISGYHLTAEQVDPFDLCLSDGRKIKFRVDRTTDPVRGDWLDFYDNDQPKHGLIDQNVRFPLYDGEREFLGIVPLRFYEIGRVAYGQISEVHATLTTSRGLKELFTTMPILEFDEQGRVVTTEHEAAEPLKLSIP